MSGIRAYMVGMISILRQLKIVLLIYLSNLLLGLFCVYPVKSFLEDKVGKSLSLQESLPQFDFTFLTDVLNNFGDSVSLLLNQSVFVIVIYILLFVFWTGGIIYTITSQESDWKQFWEGCYRFFFRLLRLTIFYFFIHGVLLYIFVQLFQFFSGGLSPFGLNTDNDWIKAFWLVTPIYVLFLSLVIMIHDAAKVEMVAEDRRSVFLTSGTAFINVFKNILPFLFFYLLFSATLFGGIALCSFLNGKLGGAQSWGIVFIFIISQILILFRIEMKVMKYGGIYEILK